MKEKEYLKTLNEIKSQSGEFINIVSSFCEYINKECMNNRRGVLIVAVDPTEKDGEDHAVAFSCGDKAHLAEAVSRLFDKQPALKEALSRFLLRMSADTIKNGKIPTLKL